MTPAEALRQASVVAARIERELLGAVLRARHGLPLSALERALLERNLDTAVRLAGLEPVLAALGQTPARAASLRALGWDQALRGLPRAILGQTGVRVTLGAFAAQHPAALQAFEAGALARVRAMSEETRAAVRETLRRALEDGTNPREAARQLRDIVGLTRRQGQAVAGFRARLVAQGRDSALVARLTDRYSRRLLTLRTEAIARTETLGALNAGARAQRERLQAEGVLRAEAWEQEWATAEDERVCPICLPLDGTRAPIGGAFPGGLLGPPAHVNCRCTTVTVLKGFRAGESRRAARLAQGRTRATLS